MLTGINTVLRASPETPCVLLLVSAPGAEATALRMAQALALAVQVMHCMSEHTATTRKSARCSTRAQLVQLELGQTVLRGWPGASSSPQELELMGDSFASSDDYWRLYETLSRRLEEQRVALVRDLQAVHPRAATAIAHLCDDTFPPFPQVTPRQPARTATCRRGSASAVHTSDGPFPPVSAGAASEPGRALPAQRRGWRRGGGPGGTVPAAVLAGQGAATVVRGAAAGLGQQGRAAVRARPPDGPRHPRTGGAPRPAQPQGRRLRAIRDPGSLGETSRGCLLEQSIY